MPKTIPASPEAITHEVKEAIFKLLFNARLSNYGYGYTAWNRISKQRQRAKAATVRLGYANWTAENVAWALRNGRLIVKVEDDGTHKAEYIVGQSENEEFTNLLRRLINPAANWVS